MLAQVLWGRPWNIGELAILIIVVAAICAIVYTFLQYSGVALPPIVVKLFWILVGAFLCILAIRIVMTM